MLIYLIGYMGSGKTTVGKKLAAKMDYSFLDLDKMIEHKFKITIPDLFAKYDEKTFRKLEQETLLDTFTLANTVISTGGGTPCFYDNMELINKNGLSVYLKMHPKSLYERLIKSKKKRPLLANKSTEEILKHISMQVIERESFYLQSNLMIKGESMDIRKLVESITNHMKQNL